MMSGWVQVPAQAPVLVWGSERDSIKV